MKNKLGIWTRFVQYLCILAAGMLLPIACSSGTGSGSGTASATAPAITTASLPGGVVGTAYSQALTATGTAPITWGIDSGLLPDGLTLNAATGVISGTPTVVNTFTFIVKAANAAGNDTKTFSVVIIPTYTVTFEDYYDINEDLEVQVSQGDTVTKPTNPTKTAEAGLSAAPYLHCPPSVLGTGTMAALCLILLRP